MSTTVLPTDKDHLLRTVDDDNNKKSSAGHECYQTGITTRHGPLTILMEASQSERPLNGPFHIQHPYDHARAHQAQPAHRTSRNTMTAHESWPSCREFYCAAFSSDCRKSIQMAHRCVQSPMPMHRASS